MSCSLIWKNSALHDLKGIARQRIPDIIAAIEALSDNPKPPQSLKLIGTESTFRLRLGDYRVIYQLDEVASSITIQHIRHRKDAYRR